MTAKERTMWGQAVRVLRRNTVTHTLDVETRKAERVLVSELPRRGGSWPEGGSHYLLADVARR